jgi:probable HAF family extracellular repeat protein
MWTKTIITSLFVSLISTLAVSQSAYTVTDLGPLSPTGINSWAQVVGSYNAQAFLWTKSSGMKGLGILSGGSDSTAAAINVFGVVTGTADGTGTQIFPNDPSENQTCSDLIQPFVWTSLKGIQGLGTLGTFPPASWGCYVPFSATAINDLGGVVGYTGELGSYQYAFLWTPTENMSLFGDTYPPTFANGINNLNEIVGQNSSHLTFGTGHATYWKQGSATDLGTLGGGADIVDFGSSANGVNDLGEVVGWSTTAPDWTSVHAVLWKPNGAVQDLGTLSPDTSSSASEINIFGQVIGSSGDTLVNIPNIFGETPYPLEVIGRPFLWSQRTGMLDLNTLIPAYSGWVLQTATGINIWGQIVGEGTLNGQPHGFLLTPRNPF